jgi:HupE / UreJ protein
LAVWAHPMPNSVMLLSIREKNVVAELQLPLSELGLALGQPLILNDCFEASIKQYILNHWKIENDSKQFWKIELQTMHVDSVLESLSGPYHELQIKLLLTPPTDASNRVFTMHYDVITHQVTTHSTLIRIRQDWQTGIIAENEVQIGVIATDIRTNTVLPMRVQQAEGSLGRGFRAMFRLGMTHISEGTDHLLFLLMLLIPAPLLVEDKRWTNYGGLKYSFWKLLRIITAFTIGHSITLVFGTLGWIPFSSRWIEILIAFSIFCSSIHAILPIFYRRETYIAGIFGLIHGLAFSNTLSNLQLSNFQTGLSILGFNLGIEWMQFGIMAAILPSLLLICRHRLGWYQLFRLLGAVCGMIAAIAWMMERVSQSENSITKILTQIPVYGYWFVVELAIIGILSWYMNRRVIH